LTYVARGLQPPGTFPAASLLELLGNLRRDDRLVTFDRTIPVSAVTGASTDSLEVIAPAE
jgi:hypothetical protein